MFLSTVIPRSSSPGRNIDVCLRSLIDELVQLWSSGALIYDIDTTKRLMSSPKCRRVEVINNPARPGSNHIEVNCINYK